MNNIVIVCYIENTVLGGNCMLTQKFKDVQVVLLMFVLTFSIIVGSFITNNNIFDLLYIIFVICCVMRYIFIIKED